MKQKITSHLWFDKEAREAAEFYTSVFKDSKIKDTSTIHNTPSGDTDIVTIELLGQEFTLISAGPLFRFNPSISFLVACNTKEEVDALWHELSKGGKALMDLGTYPFSERYGWTQDKYGLSWQLMFFGDRPIRQRIIPTLMFVGMMPEYKNVIMIQDINAKIPIVNVTATAILREVARVLKDQADQRRPREKKVQLLDHG